MNESKAIAAKQSAEPVRIWPFVESPGEFASRLEIAHREFDGDYLAAVRCVLIERPPVIATPPSPTAVEAPSLREALKSIQNLAQSGGDAEDLLGTIDKLCRAALASPTAGPTQTSQRASSVALTAKQRYDELRVEEDESDPVERLRAFCSFSMNGQDWCDSEAFFTAILACRGLSEARDAPDREALAKLLYETWLHSVGADWLAVADAAIAALTGDSKP